VPGLLENNKGMSRGVERERFERTVCHRWGGETVETTRKRPFNIGKKKKEVDQVSKRGWPMVGETEKR